MLHIKLLYYQGFHACYSILTFPMTRVPKVLFTTYGKVKMEKQNAFWAVSKECF